MVYCGRGLAICNLGCLDLGNAGDPFFASAHNEELRYVDIVWYLHLVIADTKPNSTRV